MLTAVFEILGIRLWWYVHCYYQWRIYMKYLCFFHFVLLKLNVSNCCHTKNLCLYIIFYLKIKKKLTFPLKCIHFYNGAKVTNNCILCIYILSCTWKTTKHKIQYKKKGLKTSFFLQIGWNSTKIWLYQALWQIKTKEEAQKYMHTNLFFFPL